MVRSGIATARESGMGQHATNMRAMIAGALIVAAQQALAVDPWYQGRRLTVLINFAAGGPTDIEGRLFARHIGRLTPGAPNVVVQNMDGGGGAVGTNFLGEVAPKDGTVVGYLTGPAWRHVSVPERARVDFLTYNSVAYQPGTSVYYARSDVAPGLKASEDLLKARNLIVGGLTVDSSKDLLERLTLDLLGLRYRYVTGYTSNATARLALQRSEINFFAESPAGYRSVVVPNFVEKREVVPLYYDPQWNGSKFAEPMQAKGLGLEPFPEFYRRVKGGAPAGKAWDVYLHMLAINGAMQRMVVLPPGVPKEALAALREGIRRLEKDTAFAADAEKSLGYVPDYEAGEGVQEEVNRALAVPTEDKAWLMDYIAKASK
jgi:tripartite-type tricarboxylate transporter receptor subunit TctC